MNKMQKLVSAAVLAMAAAPASAVFIHAPGGSINLPENQQISIGSVFENVVLAPGDTLRGVGEISSINGNAISTYCSAACELTFRFDNYVVSTISPTSVRFTGGVLNVYLAFGAEVDFNPFSSGSSAADLAAATNGSVFLNLVGAVIDPFGNTLAANGNILPPGTIQFFGGGLLDVDTTGTGLANDHYDTNVFPAAFNPGGSADLVFDSSGSSANPPHPGECPGGPECIQGSATLNANVVPEPGTLALLGLAFGGLAFGLRRRKVEVNS